jgi:hypothetical protein
MRAAIGAAETKQGVAVRLKARAAHLADEDHVVPAQIG